MKRIAEPVITQELCSYGCGQVARYKNGSGNLMCCDRHNKCPENRKRNSEGIKLSYSTGNRESAVTRYEKLPQETKNKMAWSRGKFSKTIFEYGKGGNHKGLLIQERGHKCESCNLEQWLGQPITLELEHIDGDNQNNIKENLKLLCPNCHSFTDTWKGRNVTKKKDCSYVTDEDFLNALKESKNIRQALLKLRLTPKGANYERAYNLMNGGLVKLVNTSDLSSDALA